MDGELYFNTHYIRGISEDISNIRRVLQRYSERLDGVHVRETIFSGNSIGDLNQSNISKSLSGSMDLIEECLEELSDLEEILDDTAYIYERAEREAVEFVSGLPDEINTVNIKESINAENNINYQADFPLGSFDNIKTRHISSNELIMPDWLMDAAVKFNILLEETKDADSRRSNYYEL